MKNNCVCAYCSKKIVFVPVQYHYIYEIVWQAYIIFSNDHKLFFEFVGIIDKSSEECSNVIEVDRFNLTFTSWSVRCVSRSLSGAWRHPVFSCRFLSLTALRDSQNDAGNAQRGPCTKTYTCLFVCLFVCFFVCSLFVSLFVCRT